MDGIELEINEECQILRAVAHIPGANIKEFLETTLNEAKRPQIPRLSNDGEFAERKTVDQKFFSVSGTGFGQQPLEALHLFSRKRTPRKISVSGSGRKLHAF